MKQQDTFLARHGILPADNFAGYHYAYALYAFYMIDAMQKAEEVEDGLCFVAMKGCRLEKGRIIGSGDEAAETAGMWYDDYLRERGSVFSFEVGIYILFLLGKDIDYSFLLRRRE